MSECPLQLSQNKLFNVRSKSVESHNQQETLITMISYFDLLDRQIELSFQPLYSRLLKFKLP